LTWSDGSGIWCHDLKTQEILWTHTVVDPKGGIHSISFNERSGGFVTYGRDERRLYLDPRNGKVLANEAVLVSPGFLPGFCQQGSAFLAGNLCLYSTESGSLLGDLATSELLAWDPQARVERFRELATSGRSLEDLEKYMTAEGFPKKDIVRVLLMKAAHDRKNSI
jgi:hypothetical protein